MRTNPILRVPDRAFTTDMGRPPRARGSLFSELPCELIQLIGNFLPKARHLLLVMKVCKRFSEFLTQDLYKRFGGKSGDIAKWAVENGQFNTLQNWLNFGPRFPPGLVEKPHRTIVPLESRNPWELQGVGEFANAPECRKSEVRDLECLVRSHCAVCLAAKRSQHNMLELLLSKGKNLFNLLLSKGKNLFNFNDGFRVETLSRATFEILVRHHADPGSWADPLIGSIARGDMELTRFFVGKGMKPYIHSSQCPGTAAYWAACRPDSTALKILAQNTADLREACRSQGVNPSHPNFFSGCSPTTAHLLPLYAAACVAPTLDCLRLLLSEEYSIPSKDPIPIKIVTDLIKSIKKNEYPRNRDLVPVCLDQARYFRAFELLLDCGLDPNTNYRGGDSDGPLLFLAARLNMAEVVELLLRKGATLGNDPSPLLVALKWYSMRAATSLIEAGADLRPMDGTNSQPCSFLIWGVAIGDLPFFKYLLDVIKRGPRIKNVKKEDIRSLKQEDYMDMMINISEAETPLTLAAKKQELIMAKLLLQNGAAVHLQNEFGETPIMKAAQYLDTSRKCTRDMCRMLLSYGADPYHYDLENKNAFSVVASRPPSRVPEREQEAFAERQRQAFTALVERHQRVCLSRRGTFGRGHGGTGRDV